MTRFVSGRAAGKTSYSLNAHSFAVLLKLLLVLFDLAPIRIEPVFCTDVQSVDLVLEVRHGGKRAQREICSMVME
jgi:hypothetical protein